MSSRCTGNDDDRATTRRGPSPPVTGQVAPAENVVPSRPSPSDHHLQRVETARPPAPSRPVTRSAPRTPGRQPGERHGFTACVVHVLRRHRLQRRSLTASRRPTPSPPDGLGDVTYRQPRRHPDAGNGHGLPTPTSTSCKECLTPTSTAPTVHSATLVNQSSSPRSSSS